MAENEPYMDKLNDKAASIPNTCKQSEEGKKTTKKILHIVLELLSGTAQTTHCPGHITETATV